MKSQTIKLVFLIFSLVINYSCKKNIESKVNNSDIVLADVVSKQVESSIVGENKNTYVFKNVFFQGVDEYDFADITEEEVIEKFKNSRIFKGSENIIINNKEFIYNQKKEKLEDFFKGTNNFKHFLNVFKNFFNVNSDKEINGLSLVSKNESNKNFDYAIIDENNIYIIYNKYFVCFAKLNPKSVLDKTFCKTPFDYEHLNRLCQRDEREKYSELCNAEYPIFNFQNNNELKKIIGKFLPNKKLLHYYNIKTNVNDLKVIVVITEHEEESYGDQFIFTLKNDSIVSLITDDKDDFFHSKNFTIDKNLKVTFYEINGRKPKEKVYKVYIINEEGEFEEVK